MKTSDIPFVAITVVIALAAVWAVNHFTGNILVKGTVPA
jgi:hypothetical protein